MSDVQVGMRLESSMPGALSPITVTEITPRGFKYKLDAIKPLRADSYFNIDGHEHYGHDGMTDYRLLPPSIEKARKLIEAWCSDPEMWGTHGCPGEHKLARLENDIAIALQSVSTTE